jgi:hypothetical protein
MSDYEGTPCPVPNCQGFLKRVDKEMRCDYGHILKKKIPEEGFHSHDA